MGSTTSTESDCAPEPTAKPVLQRRRFLAMVGGSAAAAVGLAACADDGPDGSAAGGPASGAVAGSSENASPLQASVADHRGGSVVPELTPVAELTAADADEVHMTYAPAVPPPITRTEQRIVEFAFDVVETEAAVDPANEVSAMVWGFRIAGDDSAPFIAPGPVMRARVGDLARITVNNLPENTQPHNIDWHAVTGQGGGAEATTVAPGESATINARILYPGAFMYHCAFGDVPQHISHGMYGMFIVDPDEALPEVDVEWAIVQSEWYLTQPGEGGLPELDRDRLTLEHPMQVTFNGRTDALIGDNALPMEVGQRARIYMVNAGLNLVSNFHPIGSQWDVVYPEGATHGFNRVIRGSQTTLVPAGGGTVAEVVAYVPATILLVDHALVRTFYKGALGQIVVSGESNAIFAGSDEELEQAADPELAAPPPADGNTVVIPSGAWDPANADAAYTPGVITVPVGTTITWRNDDSVQHTVTSGSSDGAVGTPDGSFDSGLMANGDTFTRTFDEAGTFDYYCTPHPWMIGQVQVTD